MKINPKTRGTTPYIGDQPTAKNPPQLHRKKQRNAETTFVHVPNGIRTCDYSMRPPRWECYTRVYPKVSELSL